MRMFHLSDLHIGKQLHGFSLLEDQVYIFDRILDLIRERKPDVVLVAGDIYDKSVPSAEAVEAFDDFLTALADLPDGPAVCMISGNHDSQERLAYGSRLFAERRLHIAGNPPSRECPQVSQVVFYDAEGEVRVYLLPYLRPSFVREIPGMEEVKSYEEAVAVVVQSISPDDSVRNVLLCHQFFTYGGKEPERSDSETIHVGGQDNVDVSVVSGFDYVAAGHIHRPQYIGRKAQSSEDQRSESERATSSERVSFVRYCGSPLKYSVSEAGGEKSVTEIELGAKGDVTVQTFPLIPLHDVRKIQGTLAELTSEEVLAAADPEDYVSVVLTDEEDLYEPGQALARVYPRLLEWRMENSRTRYEMQEREISVEKRSLLDLFGDFYLQMRGAELDEAQREAMTAIMREAGGESK